MSKLSCILFSVIAIIMIVTTGVNIVNMSPATNLVEIIVNFVYIALSGVMLGLCIVHCALEGANQSIDDKFREEDEKLEIYENAISNLQEKVEEVSWKIENPLGIEVRLNENSDWVAIYCDECEGLQQIELPFTLGFYYIETTKDQEVIIVKAEKEETSEYMIEEGVLVKLKSKNIKKSSKK